MPRRVAKKLHFIVQYETIRRASRQVLATLPWLWSYIHISRLSLEMGEPKNSFCARHFLQSF